jgi:hypothetical protein
MLGYMYADVLEGQVPAMHRLLRQLHAARPGRSSANLSSQHFTTDLSSFPSDSILHIKIGSCNMAPSKDLPIQDNGHYKKQEFGTAPAELGGHLKGYRSLKSTPVIGTEFPDANLAEWLTASNSDELIRDLAITSKCGLTIVWSPID